MIELYPAALIRLHVAAAPAEIKLLKRRLQSCHYYVILFLLDERRERKAQCFRRQMTRPESSDGAR